MLYAIVGMLVIIFDQVVKYWVDKNLLEAAQVIDLIPGAISLTRVYNDGAAFSFLSGGSARIWFIGITGLFTVLVIIALVTDFISGKFGRWCMVLVTAGGLSNCIDRVLYGYVVDMFKIDLFNFAVFNVADIFITVFCILFIIYILFGGEKELDDDADEFDIADRENDDRISSASGPRRRKMVVPEEDTQRTTRVREDAEKDDRAGVIERMKKDERFETYQAQARATQVQKSNPLAADASDDFEKFFSTSVATANTKSSNKKNKDRFNNLKNLLVEKPIVSDALENDVPIDIPDIESNVDPFAEWDQVNANKPESKFNSYVSEDKAPVKDSASKNAPASKSDEEFNVDDIMKEFNI